MPTTIKAKSTKQAKGYTKNEFDLVAFLEKAREDQGSGQKLVSLLESVSKFYESGKIKKSEYTEVVCTVNKYLQQHQLVKTALLSVGK